MTIIYHDEMIQGSDEWRAARCGMLTASEMHLIITPTLKVAANDKQRAHFYELMAQRITKYVDPHYVSDDMLRGEEDEVFARDLYNDKYARVAPCGFVTRDDWGFKIGYSPDGLVGDDGLIECKSRGGKFQVQTILDTKIPKEYIMQVQTGLLVTGRAWCDFVSYSGGLPMLTERVFPDEKVHGAIEDAAREFEAQMGMGLARYRERITTRRCVPTIRREREEMRL
jgi:predicted phage-related endonuclease